MEGLNPPTEPSLVPKVQLEYWIRANKRTIQFAKNKLESNFLLLNFDDFCVYPEKNIRKLLKFINHDANENLIMKFSKMVKIPDSIGRYKHNDLSIFSAKQLEEVQKLGFTI